MAHLILYAPTILYETYNMTVAVVEDIEQGTTRNTTEALLGACGGGAGAAGGSFAGKAVGRGIGRVVGNALCPGMGPACEFVGSLVGEGVGASVGCVLGDDAAKERASKFFDKKDYNVSIYKCESCGKRFKCRRNTRQSRKYCKKCNDEDWEF